jgi:glycosyltransferase involved in cell wall biosynthesis
MTQGSPKLLLVSYYYPPAGGAALPGSQRTVKFIRYFRRFDCHVLTLKEECYREYIDLNFRLNLPVSEEKIYRTGNFDLFKLLLELRTGLKKLLGRQMQGAEGIEDAKGPPRSKSAELQIKKSLFQKFKDFVYNIVYFPDDAGPWLLSAIWHGRKVIKEQKIDMIFATGMPWTSLIVAYYLHKLTGKPFVVDFRDPWVGNPFHVSHGRFLDWLMRSLERRIVASATYVSANTDPLHDDFLRRYPFLSPEKVVVLPNGYDLNDFSGLDTATGDPVKLVLAHAGSLYGRRDPSPLLNVFRLLKVQTPETPCRFIQMGYIEPAHSFDLTYSDLSAVGLVEDAGMLPYQECLKRLAAADVAVIIQPATKTQVPSKLYDYIAMKKYILAITPLNGILAQMMREHHLGDVFDPADIAGICDRLKELAEQKAARRGSLPVAYRDAERFNVEKVSGRLEELLLTVFSAKH